jgi:hypothetical protein
VRSARERIADNAELIRLRSENERLKKDIDSMFSVNQTTVKIADAFCERQAAVVEAAKEALRIIETPNPVSDVYKMIGAIAVVLKTALLRLEGGGDE